MATQRLGGYVLRMKEPEESEEPEGGRLMTAFGCSVIAIPVVWIVGGIVVFAMNVARSRCG